MTDSEILEALRSDDQKQRREALRALYPDKDVVMIEGVGNRFGMACTPEHVTPTLFTALLWAAQAVGGALGLQLHWLPTQDQRQLVVPRGPLQLMK